MKLSVLKKSVVALGAAYAVLVFSPNSHAATTVFIEGGSASRTVLYDRATNLYAGGTFTSTGTGSSNVRRFTGTSLNANLTAYNPITVDINVANGAIAGLQALTSQTAGPGDTNINGVATIPTFVDSATSPEAVGIDSTAANLTALRTYVVPLIYIKNTVYPDVNAITNLTQRQAVALQTSTNKATYYGGSSTNVIYFVGRNSQAAVRTEIDLSIYNTATIKTYTNTATGLPVQDTSADPGYSAASGVTAAVLAITNSIGTIAVQDLKSTLAQIPYEGVPYSVTNVINGAYPIWGYEHYYFITSPNTGAPDSGQQAVINAFYQSVTNTTFQSTSNPIFSTNFVPWLSMKVKRDFDGGPIKPLPGY
jgi:phosphate transport system substrate-binding protein